VRVPSHVPRDLEPYKKRALFDKRVRQLRAAVGARPDRLSDAAEKVRRAALAVVKAKRALCRGADRAKQLSNLRREEERWLALAVEDIIAQVAK
jgi:hypothetical protein